MSKMLEHIDKNLLQNIFNSNEFKGWLLSRRWFGDKYALSNLEFSVTIEYFQIIADKIFISIIKIETPNYSKSYFLPLMYYKKIHEILEMNETEKDNIIRLTEITFSKKIVLRTVSNKIFTLNLVEAEFCLFFWKKILFDKEVSETFPSLSLDLSLYSEQFQDEISMGEVQNFVEASLFPERYDFTLTQLGGGNTTNSLFMLNLFDDRSPEQKTTMPPAADYRLSTLWPPWPQQSLSRQPMTAGAPSP